jgi:TonB-linked SusC/RagA family outer membrane protein
MMNPKRSVWPIFGLPLAAFLLIAGPSQAEAQEPGVVEGTVVSAETGEPLPGVQVSIVDTGLGSLTDDMGDFRISNVPAGEHRVRFQMIGYASRTEPVTVQAGEIATVDLDLSRAVIDVEEIVVTGVTEATERARVPFSVGRTGPEIREVSASSVAQSLTGQLAGVSVVQGSGRPGAAPDILLRGPTSIDGAGRDQGPLVIVDGVILGAEMVDIDALDVENIEVIKGAAASSLYGSRAAQGVIQITTQSGAHLDEDDIRYSFRTEWGMQELDGTFDLAQRHYFRMNEAGTAFLDQEGRECGYPGAGHERVCENFQLAGQRAATPDDANFFNTFATEEYPQRFDNIGAVFDPGNWLETALAVEGRSGGTNFRVSYSNLREDGVVADLSGFRRHNFRVRLNQVITENLHLSATAFASRSDDDDMLESQGNPIFSITRMPAGANIMAEDEDGIPIRRPDPEQENQNPLIDLRFIDRTQERSRTMAATDLRYSPVPWLSLDGNVSYDRLDWSFQQFRDVGFPTARPAVDNFDLGTIWKESSITEALNTSANITGRWTFGELATRIQGRYLYEEQTIDDQGGSGVELATRGVPTLGNLDNPERIDLFSSLESIRSEGLFLGANLDFRERYIVDALFRRDGSSLFGADERWQNYYRVAGAYRLGQEEFFDVPAIDELRLRASIGTAGGRPPFPAQYETFSVAAGVITPATLGNRELRPEHATEQEFGVDVLAFGRLSAEITYARSEVEDQIMRVPLPAAAGFSQQWQNAGTIRSNTLELALDAQIVQQPTWSWSGRLMFDRTRQRISELAVPDFTYGVAGQNMGDIFFAREGESLGTFYGGVLATNCSQLPADARPFCDSHFDLNDDGLMVFVGEGGTWRDAQWGTTGEVGGQSFNWGLPVTGVDIDPITGEESDFVPVGNTTPDYTISASSTVRFGNFSVYGLVDAVQGVDVWNQPLQWATFQHFSGIMDDSGKPEEEQKPVAYYDFLYQSFGLQPTSFWVQDASFVKLREVALRYRLGADRIQAIPGLAGVRDVAISLTGRNLLTFTDYNGYDPEVGRGGGDVGSGALARVDGFNYPNFRTFAVGVEVNF